MRHGVSDSLTNHFLGNLWDVFTSHPIHSPRGDEIPHDRVHSIANRHRDWAVAHLAIQESDC